MGCSSSSSSQTKVLKPQKIDQTQSIIIPYNRNQLKNPHHHHPKTETETSSTNNPFKIFTTKESHQVKVQQNNDEPIRLRIFPPNFKANEDNYSPLSITPHKEKNLSKQQILGTLEATYD